MVKRYDTVGVGGEADERECPDGEFVRYEDYEAEIAAWRLEVRLAQALAERAKQERDRILNRVNVAMTMLPPNADGKAWDGDNIDVFVFDAVKAMTERADKAERERDELLVTNAKEIGKRKDVERQRDEAVAYLNEYADHAMNSGWHNLADEIRSRVARITRREGEGE